RVQRRPAIEVDRDDVSQLEVDELLHGDASAAEHRRKFHLGILDFVLERLQPALIVLDPIARDTRVQQLTKRLDHRVRHRDMKIPAAAVELDVKARHDHDLGRAHDVCEVRVDLRVDVFDVETRDRRPGFFRVREDVLQQEIDDARLGYGELASLDLREAPVAAEEIVDDGKDELRIEHDERRTAMRHNSYEMQTGRDVQSLHVLAELEHLDRRDRDFRPAAQHIEEARAKEAREALVDHLERGHAPAHDSNLIREIVGTHLARSRFRLGVDGSAIDAVQEGVDFVFAQYVVWTHSYRVTREG